MLRLQVHNSSSNKHCPLFLSLNTIRSSVSEIFLNHDSSQYLKKSQPSLFSITPFSLVKEVQVHKQETEAHNYEKLGGLGPFKDI